MVTASVKEIGLTGSAQLHNSRGIYSFPPRRRHGYAEAIIDTVLGSA
jgi:hypothetical protein